MNMIASFTNAFQNLKKQNTIYLKTLFMPQFFKDLKMLKGKLN